MRVFRNTFVPILVGILITLALGVAGGMFGGACHCVTPISVVFPYGTLVTMHTSWQTFGFMIAVIQFPLYGVLWGNIRGTRARVVLAIALLGIHCSAIILALKLVH